MRGKGGQRDEVNLLSPAKHNTIPSHTHTAAGHVWYMKLPMHLFFYMELGLNDFDEGKFIMQVIGRGGP
jgi:hypothetical protein